MIKSETVRLDVAEDGLSGVGLLGFEGASTDGSRAFFTDNAQLVEGAGVQGSDLYVCELGPEGSTAALSVL